MESNVTQPDSQQLVENAALPTEDITAKQDSLPISVPEMPTLESTEGVEMEEEERRRSMNDERADAPTSVILPISVAQPNIDESSRVHIVPSESYAASLERTSDQDLAGKLDRQERELTEIKRELNEVRLKLATIEEERSPAPPLLIPVSNFEELLAETRSKEAAGLVDDRKSLAKFQQELSYWNEAAAILQEDISSSIEKSKGILVSASEAKASLAEALQERLQSRHQGMELIGKMLARLTERVASLHAAVLVAVELRPLNEEGWSKLLQGGPDPKKLESKLRGLEAERYQVVTQARDLAEGQRKRLLNFVEKQILPIVDAIDDGEKLSLPFVTKADEITGPGGLQPLTQWFNTYSLLRAELLGTVAKMNVRPMTIQIGEMVDYMRHEPFDTVQDPALPTEAVKEEMRRGYEHMLSDGQASTVLRAAQVVVVRN